MESQKSTVVIVAVSDTHGYNTALPKGDIYIHCGDFSNSGSVPDIVNFCNYLSSLPFKHKIVIGGNHELSLDRHYNTNSEFMTIGQCNQLRLALKKHCIYLEHQSVEVEGIRIFGSPYTFRSSDGAYRYNKEQAKSIWEIGEEVDILVTHGPPFGILDKSKGQSVGCQELQKAVFKIRPKYHLFGHIHSGYGHSRVNNIDFFNCSQVDERYNFVSRPHVIDYQFKV